MNDKLGLQLKGMSVAELEDLQKRVAKELTSKLCERVPFSKFDFEACDDRSMGRLAFKVQTKYGVLNYDAYLGNGYSDVKNVSLDGAEKGEGLDCLEVPDFHNDTSEDEAKRECAKAVLAFETAYEEFLDEQEA